MAMMEISPKIRITYRKGMSYVVRTGFWSLKFHVRVFFNTQFVYAYDCICIYICEDFYTIDVV